MSMSIRAMQCFVAVVSTGSISRAAAALHVAQPALSLLMRNLEEDLGVVLLHRSARGRAHRAGGRAWRTPGRSWDASMRRARTCGKTSTRPAAPYRWRCRCPWPSC